MCIDIRWIILLEMQEIREILKKELDIKERSINFSVVDTTLWYYKMGCINYQQNKTSKLMEVGR